MLFLSVKGCYVNNDAVGSAPDGVISGDDVSSMEARGDDARVKHPAVDCTAAGSFDLVSHILVAKPGARPTLWTMRHQADRMTANLCSNGVKLGSSQHSSNVAPYGLAPHRLSAALEKVLTCQVAHTFAGDVSGGVDHFTIRTDGVEEVFNGDDRCFQARCPLLWCCVSMVANIRQQPVA